MNTINQLAEMAEDEATRREALALDTIRLEALAMPAGDRRTLAGTIKRTLKALRPTSGAMDAGMRQRLEALADELAADEVRPAAAEAGR